MNKKEWQEENLKIADKIRKHYKKYRKNICFNCNLQQRERRNCINIDGETQCNHMIRTTTTKFRNEIYIQLKKIKELEEVRQTPTILASAS